MFRQYFPSIDHDLLKAKLRRRIEDSRVLDVLDRIIDGSPRGSPELCYFPADDLFTPIERCVGIPIGNLTSQFFANLYLDDLDHHIKQVLNVRPYLRYVDDMVVLDHDKARLAKIRAAVRERLAADRLRLHPHKLHITRVADGLNLLGYLVYPSQRRLRNDNGYRFARTLRRMAKAYQAGQLEWATLVASAQSWIGHAKHADTEGLRRADLLPGRVEKGNGPRDGQRVLRGGSWNNKPQNLRVLEPEQEQRRQPEQLHRLPSCPVRPHGKWPVPEPACSRTGRARPRVSMSLLPGLPRERERRIEGLG